MKKYLRMIGAAMLGTMIVAVCASAAEGGKWYQIENSLHLGYDDNPYGARSGSDKDGGFYISERLGLSLESNRPNGFAALGASSRLTWWDRDNGGNGDDIDWNHRVEFEANQKLSERFSVSLLEHFSVVDRPDMLADDGTVRRPEYQYTYNTLNAGLITAISPALRMSTEGRWQYMRYDYKNDEVNLGEDYDIYAAGVTLSRAMSPASSVLAQARYERMDYVNAGKAYGGSRTLTGMVEGETVRRVPDRSADSVTAALGVERVFNQNLMGKVLGGFWSRQYDADLDDDNSPYVEASVTVMPSPMTRITAAGAYVSYQSSLTAFASQRRTSMSLAVAHDITSKITVGITGVYFMSDYEADRSAIVDENGDIIPGAVEDGSEESWSLSGSIAYRIDQRNSVEVNATTYSIESDFGRDMDRTSYGAGWRLRL